MAHLTGKKRKGKTKKKRKKCESTPKVLFFSLFRQKRIRNKKIEKYNSPKEYK